MRRAFKIIGWTLGGLVLLIGLLGVAAYFFVTSDFVRAQIENRANAESGRKTTIGRIAIDWGWISRVHLDNVAISNTDWAKVPHMFAAQEIAFDIRLWPLLHGDIVMPRLLLRQPQLDLERDQQDQSNWSPQQSPAVHAAVQQVKPQQRHETPLIGQLEIIGGHLNYTDAKRKLDLSGTVQTATGKAGAQPQAELALKGSIEGQPLTLRFTGGSALMLRETDQPYPVNLQVDYGETHLALQGTLQDPFQFSGANVQLSLAGPNLADIYPLLGIPGPPTPPYRIAGRLSYQPGVWHVTNMAWHAGDSDLTGEVSIDQRSKPSRLTANLVSQRLAFADLAPLVGATPGKRGNVSGQQARTEQQLEAAGNLFPNVPLHVERLRAMNMDVKLDAKRVVAPSYLPVQSLDAHVVVNNGEAVVRPFEMGFGGGTVAGELAVDARSNVPTARANLRYSGIALADFFRDSRFFSTTDGRIQGRIVLAGSGRSLAQVMGTANGDIVMTMEGGSISDLMVDLAGLQIGNALVLFVTGDHRIPIRCAMGRLVFEHGEVVFDKTLMDTVRSVLHFDGRASLSTQALSAKITADVKQFNLLDLHGPVVIQGKLRSPSFSIARVIPIPTPDLPTAKQTDCPLLAHELLASKP